jgi:hypothetical protein
MTTMPRWSCTACDTELEAEPSHTTPDHDGVSADATVTTWKCPSCAIEYTHWRIPRAAMVDGRIVDASRELWIGDEPKIMTEND